MYTSGFNIESLHILYIMIIISGIYIIINKNPIKSLLFLIILFGLVSCYLIFLGLTFIGLSYLIVYIGAVSILFLFILMLINIRISEFQGNTKNSVALAVFIGIFFKYSMTEILPYNNSKSLNINLQFLNENILYSIYNKNQNIYFATSYLWEGNLLEISQIAGVGSIIYTNYAIWLIITSLILLLSMVGAIIITIKPKYAWRD